MGVRVKHFVESAKFGFGIADPDLSIHYNLYGAMMTNKGSSYSNIPSVKRFRWRSSFSGQIAL